MTRSQPRRSLLNAVRTLVALAALSWSAAPATAQLGSGSPPEPAKLVRIVAAPVTVAAGGRGEVMLELTIEPTWHINANPPSPDYMIATEAKLEGAQGVAAGAPVYPAPHRLKVEFDDAPLAVFDGSARIRIPVVASATAAPGSRELTGTLRFQACNDQVCLAPATIPFRVTVVVSGGGATAAIRMTTPDTTGTTGSPGSTATQAPQGSDSSAAGAPQGAGVTPAPPKAGRAFVDNPLGRALEHGAWGGFLALFVIGLALNLTPCVYPMLGVTVSIFGARRAAPTHQVFGYALVYVLGIVVMYSALGVAAALTGGLFGSALQNLWSSSASPR